MECSESSTEEKFTAVNMNIKKEERSQIDNLNYFKKLGKRKTKHKARGGKEIIKIRVGRNKIENKKQ